MISRLGDKPMKHIKGKLHRQDYDITKAYPTSASLLDHLSQVYRNPLRDQEARRELRDLTMKTNDRFLDFFSDFEALASVAGYDLAENTAIMIDFLKGKAPSEIARGYYYNWYKF